MAKTALERIKENYQNDGLKAIGEELFSTVQRIRERSISYKQGNTEITGFKYILQSIMLDGKKI